MGLRETDRIDPSNDAAATDKDVLALQHIQDTFTTRTAVNATRYSDERGDLLLYIEGAPIEVTYYHVNFPEIDIRSGSGDISPMANKVHKDFTKIIGLEMRLQGDMQPTFVEVDNSFDILGEAIMYPGFEPNIGDEFFLSMGDGKVGEFKVNNKTPMSYRQGKCFKINFEILNYVDSTIRDRLESGVRQTLYFSKKMYPGDGDWTFLEHESFVTLRDLEKSRRDMVQYLVNNYYSEDYETFVRSDGTYDPYVVEFLQKRLTIREIKVRPRQLFTRLKNYSKSIWYYFTDRVDTRKLKEVVPGASTAFFSADALATDHNALLNRYYIVLGGVENSPYVFSGNFYSGFTDRMTGYERLVYQYLTERKIDVSKVNQLVKEYAEIPEEDRFYFIAVCIDLIDAAIHSLKGVSNVS